MRTPPYTHTHTYVYTLYMCYLWLREHVQTPGAHLAISGDANQVVGVLGANNVHAVNWVLQKTTRETFNSSALLK